MFDAKEFLNVLGGGQPAPGSAASDLGVTVERGKKAAAEAVSQAASALSSVLAQVQARLHGTEAAECAGKAKELVDVLSGGQPAPGSAPSDFVVALQRRKKAAEEAASQAASVVSSLLGQAQARLQGTEAGEFARKVKDLVDQNPVAAVAVLGAGGLAAVLVGPQVGLAAIGPLFYKVVGNLQEGKPLTQGVSGLGKWTAQEGSAVSGQAHTNDTALRLIATMIANTAADGVVDPSQRLRIAGEMKAAGLDVEPAHYLDAENQHPASVTATPPGQAFLDYLGKALSLDPVLVAQLNATASALAPPAR